MVQYHVLMINYVTVNKRHWTGTCHQGCEIPALRLEQIPGGEENVDPERCGLISPLGK